jgi:hypothetical protein
MQRQDKPTFLCPECDGEVAVTPGHRRTLIDEGCVFCGAHVPVSAFVVACPRTPEEPPVDPVPAGGTGRQHAARRPGGI